MNLRLNTRVSVISGGFEEILDHCLELNDFFLIIKKINFINLFGLEVKKIIF